MPLSLYLWFIFFGASATSYSVLSLNPRDTQSVIYTTTIQNGENAMIPTLEQSELDTSGENDEIENQNSNTTPILNRFKRVSPGPTLLFKSSEVMNNIISSLRMIPPDDPFLLNNETDSYDEIERKVKNVFLSLENNIEALTKGEQEVSEPMMDLITDAGDNETALEIIRPKLIQELKELAHAKPPLEHERFVKKLIKFANFFAEDKVKIYKHSRQYRILALLDDEVFLKQLRSEITQHDISLRSIISEMIEHRYGIPQSPTDNNAYAALSCTYYAVLALVSTFKYLITADIYLADHYIRREDVELFNHHVDQLINDFNGFSNVLMSQNSTGLIGQTISVLKEVAGMKFLNSKYSPAILQERAGVLEQLKNQISNYNSRLPVTSEEPGGLNAQRIFDDKSLTTPIGPWRDGAIVSYAVQYKGNGIDKFTPASKVGDWSDPFYVNGKSNPIIFLPTHPTRTWLIYRKFYNYDHKSVKLVGIIEPGTENKFRDVDRDLWEAARGGDESTSINEASKLIEAGANISALFEDGKSALHAAAMSGKTKFAKKFLLDSPIYIHSYDSKGYTPLHVAAERGWDSFVELMIEKGAGVNNKTKAGLTPLHLAVANDKVEVVRALMNTSDVDINAQDNNGIGILHQAVLKQNEDLVKLIIRHMSSNVNLPSDGNLTPLHLSVMLKSPDITRALLDADQIQINVRSDGNMTSLHYASISGNLPSLELLADCGGIDVNAQSVNGWTPLHYAVFLKHSKVVSALLKLKNISVNVTGAGQIAPLHIATATNQSSTVEALLEHGAWVDAPNSDMLTPLHLAAIKSNQGILTTLLMKGANVNARTRNGSTPLHIVAANGDVEAVKTILENGRNVGLELSNDLGLTALHLAARWGQLATVKILVERGAVLNIKDKDGKTALSLAIEHNHTEVVKFLREPEKISAATLRLIIGAALGELNEVKSAIAMGADIERNMAPSEGYEKQSPLVWASGAGHIDVVKYLVERGAKVNPKDVSWTALHVAAQMGKLNVVKFLVDSGADVNDRANTRGMSPIYIAAQHCHLPIVKFLMDKGAVIGLRDDYYHWTPLYAAASNGCFDVVKHLVESGAEINLKDKLGHTSLYLANCKYYKERLQDYSKIIDYFTSRGATMYGMEPNEKGCCFTFE